MADVLTPNDGILRIADAVLRSNGGRSVILRMPGPASSGDDAEQLGLANPTFNDIPLGPAALRIGSSKTTLIVSASSIKSLLTTLAFDSAQILFATAVGIIIDADLYTITNTLAPQSTSEPYCYILTLQPPTP